MSGKTNPSLTNPVAKYKKKKHVTNLSKNIYYPSGTDIRQKTKNLTLQGFSMLKTIETTDHAAAMRDTATEPVNNIFSMCPM